MTPDAHIEAMVSRYLDRYDMQRFGDETARWIALSRAKQAEQTFRALEQKARDYGHPDVTRAIGTIFNPAELHR